MWQIPLFDLPYDERETEAVIRILRGKWLSAGLETAAFESEFTNYLGINCHCLAVSNCTSALQMALHLLGISSGDEVIIPALTFVADLNVVQLTGATPVLSDCTSIDNWNLCAETISRKLSSQTKAVIVVHYAGMPCDMYPIIELCKAKGIPVIEDCAHAVGSIYYANPCGTFGNISCFSFFSNKNLSVGEGGMFVTRDPQLASKARLIRSHGMSSMTLERHTEKPPGYDVIIPGMNCRSDEIRAALGRVQLAKLKENNQLRRMHHAKYMELLNEIDEVKIPFLSMDPKNFISSFHIFPILLSSSDIRPYFIHYLKERGIQTSIHYPPMDTFTCYMDQLKTPYLAKEIATRTVTLPLYPGMSEHNISYVVTTMKDFFSSKRNQP